MEHTDQELMSRLMGSGFAPGDYLDWIQRNGWGDIGDGIYMLYNALIPLRDICPDAPEGYVSFGDDYSGFSGCFSVDGDGLVYEWDSATYTMDNTGEGFTKFMEPREAWL